MKRIAALLAALLLLIGAVSCGESSAAPQTDTTMAQAVSGVPDASAAEASAETTEAVPERLRDDLGERNYNGTQINFLLRVDHAYEMVSPEISGELVSDAIYKRNADVEKRLNVTMNFNQLPGAWSDRNTFVSKAEASIGAGDHDYDIIMTHNTYIVNIGLDGYAYDVTKISSMDTSKKWWSEAFTRDCLISGRAFFAMGDMGHSVYENLYCTFFNKTLTADNKVPDLYDIAESGEWTYEKLKEYSALGVSDVDGNGTYSTGDVFGLAFSNSAARYAVISWDIPLTEPDADGRHVLITPNEKYIDAYDKLFNLVWGSTPVYYDTDIPKGGKDVFSQEGVMLYIGDLGYAQDMKDMKSEYGIIPFPKYDADQKEYITGVRSSVSAEAIAGNVTDPEMMGAVLEALCMYGHNEVIPAYYETSLKFKCLSDARAMGMLDLIRDTASFSFALNYANYIDLITAQMGSFLNSKLPGIAAQLKAQQKIWEKSIASLYEQIDKLK